MQDKVKTFEYVITGEKSPKRLLGRKIVGIINETTHQLTFEIDMPDNPTKNELGFVDWVIGEFVDGLRQELPGMIGDKPPLTKKV